MSLDTPPLSPHLQVYRLPITALLSISHRITGVFLALGVLLLFYVLVAATAGPQAYQGAHAFVASWFGQLVLFLFTLALYFHFCNGIRHLIWDVGYGFELETIDKSAYIVLGVSIVLTLITWGIAMVSKGAGA